MVVVIGALVYLLLRFGTTRVITTKTGTTTQTVTETNALALSLVTGLVALLSAALTATLTYWYGRVAESERRWAETSVARAARTREQISSVASLIARMLEVIEASHEAAAGGALQYERADLWARARATVRKYRNDALPYVGVLDDAQLRTCAEAVFTSRETWYLEAEQAARRLDSEPSLALTHAAVASFYDRARVVIDQTEAL